MEMRRGGETPPKFLRRCWEARHFAAFIFVTETVTTYNSIYNCRGNWSRNWSRNFTLTLKTDPRPPPQHPTPLSLSLSCTIKGVEASPAGRGRVHRPRQPVPHRSSDRLHLQGNVRACGGGRAGRGGASETGRGSRGRGRGADAAESGGDRQGGGSRGGFSSRGGFVDRHAYPRMCGNRVFHLFFCVSLR